MPHFIVEYSANLDGKVDIKGLCDAILDAAIDADVFELGAIRVRALRCEAYAIADRLPENGFVDLSLRLAAGRAIEVKKKLGDAVFAAVESFLAPLFETPHFALSFEIREIDPDFSWKKNAIHPRLRGK
ncbi:5-carboxymethyl-2-hydroxymuconate isomerase [Mesorhizobium sp. L-8-10]|uniref:5-carboxymethyl-2-hydroxymuconate Delta-isomerase n=1 Tax=unclassified Mesorhizobium TaxID=325217 RepID=UPI00192770B8|nr:MULTISPECIES: 5-carboxymethyl-2-hydroxymuconate Delta-isomerase [unclassified Mesorhizobium]BCH24485.1 5-carboxymethyl-2-hydroxymuconate isomerase [Mesorhizobium sp. L-8-3]BCH32218.1 5-carboxymethyl-2-hydroxymuconate isomerase [Mesorhizobium sp. L-8-10]